jgi:hypothetical protein
MKQVKHENSTKGAPKMQQEQLGKERLAQDLEDEFTMNSLSNRLQATPRIQI